ncbi:cellulase-like family protein [Rathayibacter sp. VKM Ac-2760]|uniref:cellulase-like family protein n=1 Tax=Rathayibacter sp. VKM Ac-2760 TaxID=2609253 RepID=UPI0013181727|nr:cellulase-like family protein [Rathayibacter sp. VKM Ac-2760]QHC59949.1 hypothetical protein GSU72_16385 [Rathayibacter sp. VKM Ac-2760]
MTTPATELPATLTVCLWDFTWFTQTRPGEPLHDLDAALQQTVDRGYNTVRLCAAPLLLFGEHDLDTSALTFAPVAEGVGQGTRWYNVAGGDTLDLRARLLELFRLAEKHGVFVIVSSWEDQQNPAFLDDPSWHDMLSAIAPEERCLALARSLSRLIDFLAGHDLADRVAYVELHNEVDLSRLREVAEPGADVFWALRPYLEEALGRFQEDHPEVLSTVCYGVPPHLDLDAVPENAQVAHAHFYVYGVLGALESWAGVRAEPPVFPSPELVSLLRDDAPAFEDWSASIAPWRRDATGISPSMFYAYDWVDPQKWDAWLEREYADHRSSMQAAIDERLQAFADLAWERGIPAVVGEGWIGYTPLHADFEDGPLGRQLAEHAVRRCAELGYWGTIAGSNSAPHHPGWNNIAFQRSVNGLFRESASRPPEREACIESR